MPVPDFSVPSSGCRLEGMKPAQRPMSTPASRAAWPSKGGARVLEAVVLRVGRISLRNDKLFLHLCRSFLQK